MRIFQSKMKQAGLSLVEVMIAMGLLGAVAVGVMQVSKNLGFIMGNASGFRDESQVLSEIDMILRDEANCRVSLSLNASGEPFQFNKSILSQKEDAEDIELYFADSSEESRDKKRFSAVDQDFNKQGKATLTALKIYFPNGEAANYPANDYHSDVARILVGYERSISATQKKKFTKEIPIRVKLKTDLDGNTTLLSCSGDSMSAIEESACRYSGRFFFAERNPPCQISQASMTSLPSIGNPLGPPVSFRCPIGFGMTGFRHFLQGELITAFGIICREMGADDYRPIDQKYLPELMGEYTGITNEIECPDNTWVTGWDVCAGGVIQSVKLKCGNFENARQGEAKTVGASCTTPTSRQCPEKTIVREVNAKGLVSMNSIQGICF